MQCNTPPSPPPSLPPSLPPTQYQELLRLHYAPLTPPSPPSSLDLKLVGQGVEPVVELTPKGDSLNLGHVMAGDTVSHALQVGQHMALVLVSLNWLVCYMYFGVQIHSLGLKTDNSLL